MEANAKAKKNASLNLRVFRASTGKWEDAGEAHAVLVGLKKMQALKLKVLGYLLKQIMRVQSKLKEWQ